MSAPRAVERARALLDAGRPEEAARLLATTGADDAEGSLLLAQAHLERGAYADAVAAAERAAALAPEAEAPHRLRSFALARSGRPAEALAAAREAVRREPGDWRAHVACALAASDVPGGYAEGWAAGNEAVRLAPHEADAHFAVGVVALGAGDTARAGQAFRAALAIDPGHAGARNNLALVDLRRNRLGRAAAGFAAAAAMDPGLDLARHNIAHAAALAVRNLHWGLFGAAYLVRFLAGDADEPRASWPLRLAVAAVVAVIAVVVARLWRSTPPALRPYLRRLPFLDRLLGLWVLCEAVALAALAAIAVSPAGAVEGLFGAAILALLLGCVVSWVRHARLRRR